MDRILPYGKYRFICRIESETFLPFYKGSTFRGVFGHALRRVVCALKLKDCADCILRENCLYCSVFERSDGDAIHPFVIEPPLDGERRYRAGERFDCSLILFGDANQKLPYFVYAFEQMGGIGIGGRVNGSRGRFALEEVQAGSQVIYSAATRKLLKNDGLETLCLTGGQKKASEVRLTLETPLRLKFENKLTAELPFHVLVRAMLRRVSSLFNAFGNGEPELDYRGLVQDAENVQTRDSTLRWFDWERYSNRQNTRMLMGGIIGSVVYEGELGRYLPLLELASKLHIGKQTTFGMGKMGFEVCQPDAVVPS